MKRKHPIRKGWWLLVLTLSGAAITGAALQTFRNHPVTRTATQVIRIPVHPGHNNRPFDTTGISGLAALLHQLDSLRTDTIGRRRYDSICRLRPGLMDSLRTIIHDYALHQLLKLNDHETAH